MTSNRFLACLGEPTAMEARIGDIYQTEGLETAFAYIKKHFFLYLKSKDEIKLRCKEVGGRVSRLIGC